MPAPSGSRGEGFVAAAYRHRLSRAGDPQLHTHVVAANLTRADGRYTSLDAHALYEHKSAAGAVYRAVLRAEVRERLPWVRGAGPAAGCSRSTGCPRRCCAISRSAGSRSRSAPSSSSAPRPAMLSREQMQGIALATRRPKDLRR